MRVQFAFTVLGLALLPSIGVSCRSAPPPEPTDPLEAGAAAYGRGEWEAALAHYREALAANPDDPQLLDLEGETLMELERYDDALASLDRSVELDPLNPYAHAHRGQVLMALGRPNEALLAFELAVALAPDVDHFKGYLERARERAGVASGTE